MKDWLYTRSLGLSLLGAFLATWALQWLTHDGDLTSFINATMENWQSEFMQTGVFVIASAHLIWTGSPQSKDGDEELHRRLNIQQRQLGRIEAVLDRIRQEQARGEKP